MAEYKTDNKLRAPIVLITGASGLIGRYLTSLLLAEGFKVNHLSRKANQFGKVRVFRWDPEKDIIDPLAMEGVDYIIHLAGANIGTKRWSKRRKEEILSSRIESSKLLYRIINKKGIKLKAFVSASAAGYYGSITSEKIFTERDPPADDFLGTLCQKWEEAADLFKDIGIRTVKVRTAIVLEKSDSALSKLYKGARAGIFPILGKGTQFMPWIHIEDLCNIYLKTIRDETMHGAYNAVSPQHVNHKDFMKELSNTTKRYSIYLPVPEIALKCFMGKMSQVVLNGSRISSDLILSKGFKFKYASLQNALNNAIKQE